MSNEAPALALLLLEARTRIAKSLNHHQSIKRLASHLITINSDVAEGISMYNKIFLTQKNLKEFEVLCHQETNIIYTLYHIYVSPVSFMRLHDELLLPLGTVLQELLPAKSGTVK